MMYEWNPLSPQPNRYCSDDAPVLPVMARRLGAIAIGSRLDRRIRYREGELKRAAARVFCRAQIFPSCASMIDRQIDKPIPIPPCLVE